ncbi:hypothetical protein ES703_08615 [subsurface metagenome]|jgi:hypothetical protein
MDYVKDTGYWILDARSSIEIASFSRARRNARNNRLWE